MSDIEYNKDIMDELLSDSKVHGYIRQRELDDLLDVIHNPFLNDTSLYDYSINLEPDKKEPGRKKKNSGKTKRKTTHYLTEETFKDLGRAKMDIRKHIPEQYRSQISKTKIVNQVLAMILQEFQLKGEKSKIMQTILQSLDIK
ncbi:MAG: hypothetical protein IME97_08800 [Proteobacteria bacterium]|nr:hypothetical protein [Pseudomonadota bacterium]